jgi:hypothetical protein
MEGNKPLFREDLGEVIIEGNIRNRLREIFEGFSHLLSQVDSILKALTHENYTGSLHNLDDE